MSIDRAEFFLAANSSKGFYSLFDELYSPDEGWTAYVIKGGPGTGKSGLMRRVAKKAEESGFCVEYILCSSDPASLDAVIIPEQKICFADGTAPHVIEPKYPGCVERIIYLGQFWSEKELSSQREHIITLTKCNKALHAHSARYVSAAALALQENERIISSAYSCEKSNNYATRFISRNFTCSNSLGKEKKRFLNGITPQGYLLLSDTGNYLCDKIYTVTDDFLFCSGMFLDVLRREAIANGIDVINCLNPLNPEGNPMHLIFPNEKIGFFSSDRVNKLKSIAVKNINAQRFLNRDIINVYKQRLVFNKKTANGFLDESVQILKKAKRVHDDLEKCYISAMDFNQLNDFFDNLISGIF